MSLARVKVWGTETLTASDLNGEFNNILSSAMSLISPLTGSLDFDGFALTLDAAAATTVQSTAALAWTFSPGAKTGTPGTTGAVSNWAANTYTDNNTAISGTAAAYAANAFQRPTLAATNASVTTTDAATLYIAGSPTAGTNETITNSWALRIADSDARTATVDVPMVIESVTSGTPAAGIGTGVLFRAESADENPSDVGQAEFAFSDVNIGTEDSYFQMLLRVAGAALTSCYRFAATGAFNAIFTHANTAARTYTLPNNTQSLAGITTIVAATNFPAANTVSITDIPQTYASILLLVTTASSDTATRNVAVHVSTDNGSSFNSNGVYGNLILNTTTSASVNTAALIQGNTQTAAQSTSFVAVLTGYQAGPYLKTTFSGRSADTEALSGSTTYENAAAINALRITWNDTGNFDGGQYSLYGVN